MASTACARGAGSAGILSELSLSGYLKTSGGKGYHVVVPFQARRLLGGVSRFRPAIAEVMERKWPERYTSNVRKGRRTDKIFIDWIRNGRGATSVAPYSIRARKGARVSMPIPGKSRHWDDARHAGGAPAVGGGPLEGFSERAI
jgi:DNA primase